MEIGVFGELNETKEVVLPQKLKGSFVPKFGAFLAEMNAPIGGALQKDLRTTTNNRISTLLAPQTQSAIGALACLNHR